MSTQLDYIIELRKGEMEMNKKLGILLVAVLILTSLGSVESLANGFRGGHGSRHGHGRGHHLTSSELEDIRVENRKLNREACAYYELNGEHRISHWENCPNIGQEINQINREDCPYFIEYGVYPTRGCGRHKLMAY